MSASLASLAGGACADFFARHELSLTVRWKRPGSDIAFDALNFQAWTFFFALAFLLGLVSLKLLARVEERGALTAAIALQHLLAETRRSVSSLSSAAGLQKLARLPLALLQRRPSQAAPARPA